MKTSKENRLTHKTQKRWDNRAVWMQRSCVRMTCALLMFAQYVNNWFGHWCRMGTMVMSVGIMYSLFYLFISGSIHTIFAQWKCLWTYLTTKSRYHTVTVYRIDVGVGMTFVVRTAIIATHSANIKDGPQFSCFKKMSSFQGGRIFNFWLSYWRPTYLLFRARLIRLTHKYTRSSQ